MEETRTLTKSLHAAVVVVAISLLGTCAVCLAQEDSTLRPTVELLTMDGGKPNLSPKGEGIVSLKTSILFKRGISQVKLFDEFKFELPIRISAVQQPGLRD